MDRGAGAGGDGAGLSCGASFSVDHLLSALNRGLRKTGLEGNAQLQKRAPDGALLETCVRKRGREAVVRGLHVAVLTPCHVCTVLLQD